MKAPLTSHQRAVYARLRELSDAARVRRLHSITIDGPRASEPDWVPLSRIGSAGACEHLVDKGWAERTETRGPRGGRVLWYRVKMEM